MAHTVLTQCTGDGGVVHEDQEFKVILLFRKSALFQKKRKGRRSGKRGQEGRNEGTDGGKRKKMPVTSIKIREFLAVFCPLNFT